MSLNHFLFSQSTEFNLLLAYMHQALIQPKHEQKSRAWLVRLVLILSLWFGLHPAPLAAQEVQGLTLQQCISLALENSKSIGIAEAKADQALYRFREIRSANFPTLNAQFIYQHLSPITPSTISFPVPINGQTEFALNPNIQNQYQLNATVRQPLFNGLRTRREYLASDFTYKARQKELLDEQLEVEYNVKNLYWNLYRAREQKTILAENIKQVQAHLQDVQNFLSQNLATQNDLLKVKLQLSNVRLSAISVENAIQTTNAALCSQMGLPLDTEIKTLSSPEVSEYELSLPELDRLTENALFNRPDLRALKLQLSAVDVQYRLGHAEFAPFLNFVGSFDYNNPNQRIFPLSQTFNFTYNLSFALTYEVWSWGKRFHQLKQARSVIRQTKGGIGMLEDGIRLEVRQNYLEIRRAKEQITLARETVLQAEENFRIGKDKFQNGLILNSDLIDAETLLLNAKTNLLTAQVDYQLSVARLNKAVGQ
jgi:outer membrane protein